MKNFTLPSRAFAYMFKCVRLLNMRSRFLCLPGCPPWLWSILWRRLWWDAHKDTRWVGQRYKEIDNDANIFRDEDDLQNLRRSVRGGCLDLHRHQLLLSQGGQVHIRPRRRDRSKKRKLKWWSHHFFSKWFILQANPSSRLWSRSPWVPMECQVLHSNTSSGQAGKVNTCHKKYHNFLNVLI